MSDIQYREAVEKDIPRIIELWKEFIDFHKTKDSFFSRSGGGPKNFGQFIYENLQKNDAIVFVAEKNGEIVAHILATIQTYPPVFEKERYGLVMDLAVTEKCRRMGIGRHLFQMVKKWFFKKGMARLEIELVSANEISNSFWEKMGFIPYKKTCCLDIE